MPSLGEFRSQNRLGDPDLDLHQRLVAECLNSLMRTGQLVRTGVGSWEIAPGGSAFLLGQAFGGGSPTNAGLADADVLLSALLLAQHEEYVRHNCHRPLFGQLRVLAVLDAGIPLLAEGFSTSQSGKLIQCRRSPGGSIRFEVDPTGFIMIDDGFGGAVVKDISGNAIFRGIVANAWADNVSSTYFQIGSSGGKVVLTTATSNSAERMQLDAQWLTIGSRGPTSVPAPAGSRGIELYRFSSDTAVAGLALVQDNESSGTPAAGFGTRWEWRSESSTTTRTPQAAREVTWATATHAGRKALVVDYVYDTAQREAMRHEADGTRGTTSVPAGGSASRARVGGCIADFTADAGNVGAGMDPLYTATIAASTLSVVGDKITARFAGEYVTSDGTRQLQVAFGGTTIYDTGGLTLAGPEQWDLDVLIVMDSATTVKCSVRYASVTTTGTPPQAAYTRVTGLTLTGANDLVVQGQTTAAGTPNDQVVAKMGSVWFSPAA